MGRKKLSTQVSRDGRDLLILVFYGSGSTRTDVYFKDLAGNAPVQPIVNDTDALFMGEIENGKAILGTNWKAPKWHIYSVDLKNPARDAWKEIVPESDASFESARCSAGNFMCNTCATLFRK